MANAPQKKTGPRRAGKRLDADIKAREADAILHGEKTQADVARELGVSRQAVNLWVKRRKEGMPLGLEKTVPLSDPEKAELGRVIQSGPPSAAGIEAKHDAWSVRAIQVLMARRLGRRYNAASIEPFRIELGLRSAPVRPAPPLFPRLDAPEPGLEGESEEGRPMTAGELAYYEEKVRVAEKIMAEKGVRHALDPVRLQGIRRGKHAKGNIQQKQVKKKKRR
jgi:transposase-like protein